jgi:hypothetical protein
MIVTAKHGSAGRKLIAMPVFLTQISHEVAWVRFRLSAVRD